MYIVSILKGIILKSLIMCSMFNVLNPVLQLQSVLIFKNDDIAKQLLMLMLLISNSKTISRLNLR
jgi:hypothetical protein